MAELVVKKGSPVSGVISVPGDKSISHRSMMLASLAEGTTRVTGFLESEDCLSTAAAMRALGVKIEHAGSGEIVVHGTGGRFTEPSHAIDCGNSGTTIRLISGILAAQPFTTTLIGDESLSKRPMKRIATPLNEMGAKISGEGDKDTPPIRIEGGILRPIRYELPIASAQVKSAVLLAGLLTEGATTVVEPAPTRNHTETMLQHFGVSVQRGSVKGEFSIEGKAKLSAADFYVPGDISSAAFWLVGAAASTGNEVRVTGVGLNETRNGILAVLQRMGAEIAIENAAGKNGEPFGDVVLKGNGLKGTVIEGDEIPNVIDELPILAVAGALAEGTTIIRDAAELRVKETDRISAVAGNLAAMGAKVTESDDGMVIEGGAQLAGAELPSFGDHRIAMAFAIAGLFAEGETTILNAECVNTSYPGFAKRLATYQS